MDQPTTTLTTPTLGRYAEPGPAEPRRPVALLGLPVQVLRAAREHHDGLLRELRLLALRGPDDHPLDPRLQTLVDELGQRWAAPAPRADDAVDGAVADGVLRLDTVEHVPTSAAERLLRLEQLFGLADRRADEGLLMTVPRPPVVRQFAAWYLRQFSGQLLGGVPEPWDGPLQP
jgi:hypothetical protein